MVYSCTEIANIDLHSDSKVASIDEFIEIFTKIKNHEEIDLNTLNYLSKSINYRLDEPSQLDPMLSSAFDALFEVLFEEIKKPETSQKTKLFEIFNILVRVRGFRICEKFFKVSVEKFDVFLDRLYFFYTQKNSENYEIFFVLCYISVLILSPFQLKILISEKNYFPEKNSAEILFFLILNNFETYNFSNKIAAKSLGRLLNRKDCYFLFAELFKIYPKYLENENFIFALSQVLKFGDKNYLKLFYDKFIFDFKFLETKNLNLKKYFLKMLKNTSKLFLTHKKYSLNFREKAPDFDDNFNIPFYFNEVIDKLLFYLTDSSYSIRISCAKYLAQIAQHIPLRYSQEILLYIFELFNGVYNFSGPIFALAEFAQKGLISPENIEKAIILASKSSTFSKAKNSAEIRDSSNYFFWALSRSYFPEFYVKYFDIFIKTLLSVAIFDKEVNIRRGASAAFQEILGRSGGFSVKNGIEIMKKISYFEISNQKKSAKISVKILEENPEFFEVFVDFLMKFSLKNQSDSTKLIAAETLAEIIDFSGNYSVIDELILPSIVNYDPISGPFLIKTLFLLDQNLTEKQQKILEKFIFDQKIFKKFDRKIKISALNIFEKFSQKNLEIFKNEIYFLLENLEIEDLEIIDPISKIWQKSWNFPKNVAARRVKAFNFRKNQETLEKTAKNYISTIPEISLIFLESFEIIFDQKIISEAFFTEILLKGLENYTSTKKGDVGSIVRAETMKIIAKKKIKNDEIIEKLIKEFISPIQFVAEEAEKTLKSFKILEKTDFYENIETLIENYFEIFMKILKSLKLNSSQKITRKIIYNLLIDLKFDETLKKMDKNSQVCCEMMNFYFKIGKIDVKIIDQFSDFSENSRFLVENLMIRASKNDRKSLKEILLILTENSEKSFELIEILPEISLYFDFPLRISKLLTRENLMKMSENESRFLQNELFKHFKFDNYSPQKTSLSSATELPSSSDLQYGSYSYFVNSLSQ